MTPIWQIPLLPEDCLGKAAQDTGGATEDRALRSAGSFAGIAVREMLQYFTRTWSNMRIYYTKVYQEIWVGLALTTYAYYKISFGGKKAVADKSSVPGHH
ncbi:ATP synthase subunit ATP5MJ, mitochondrial [Chelonia mydas]|uniref:ATP synthase subunit ATP5MJ, mitochondrial n=1 Tax=Chelonia mydas TaxID=8469 RepID=UPI001CA8E2E0|nr:ATP synthase subunit ATP5MJ, mitochondrial [Chelonia mydas]